MSEIYWHSMESAPISREGAAFSAPRLLLLRQDGSVSIGCYCGDYYAKKPRPYWEDERHYLGVKGARANPPVGWIPLEDLAKLLGQPVGADRSVPTDTERLDWLESQKDVTLQLLHRRRLEWEVENRRTDKCYYGLTLRDAIDAAARNGGTA